ncbi:MAG: hypothetical protein GY874_02740, partial [Desulfobacteraceae bacterium]|nr:hypothetical protein [Desulfobacteraceae bacterium]
CVEPPEPCDCNTGPECDPNCDCDPDCEEPPEPCDCNTGPECDPNCDCDPDCEEPPEPCDCNTGPECDPNCDCDPDCDSDPTPTPGDLSYILTAVQDGLNIDDYTMMDDGLKELKYSEVTADRDVSKDSLINYLTQDITMLYHTGHGGPGFVATSGSGGLKTGDLTPGKVIAENVIWATCSTNNDDSWKDAFSDNANTIAGYTKSSFDGTDETVVKNYIKYLSEDYDFATAWYMSNDSINSLSDRWSVFAREGENVVEYSAESNNTPREIKSELVPVDEDGKLEIAEDVLNNGSDYSNAYGRVYMYAGAQSSLGNKKGIRRLKRTSLDRKNAIVKGKAYLKDIGEMRSSMVLDKTYPIKSRKDDDAQLKTVGWVTRYSMITPNGLAVRSNSAEPHKTITLTGDSEVVTASIFWPEIKIEKDSETYDVLTPGQAIEIAKEKILSRIKQGPVRIASVEPVYGIGEKGARKAHNLVPCYGYYTSDGLCFVVNAVTGEFMP